MDQIGTHYIKKNIMALSPAYKDIYYYNGDSITKSYTITDKSDGSAISQAGDTLTLTIKESKEGEAVATLTTASEISISGVSNNVVNVAFDHDVFVEKSYYYDLYNNTDDKTIMFGKFIVTKEVHD